MLGLNCLSPGQEQHLHEHAGQDKFYFVVEGTGRFVVGGRDPHRPGRVMRSGHPPACRTGSATTASERLVLLVGIAPFAGAAPVDPYAAFG